MVRQRPENSPVSLSRLLPFALALALLSVSGPADAYIGPGAGITMLGALWGVLVAILLAVGAVLYWPIKVLLRRRRRADAPAAASEETR